MHIHEKACALVEAFHYAKSFRGKVIVIKYGGNAMTDENLQAMTFADIAVLWQLGMKIVFVHGGGPFLDKQMREENVAKKVLDGLRVTDGPTLKIAQRVFEEINCACVNRFSRLGVPAENYTNDLIQTAIRDERLGYVGEVTAITTRILTDALERGLIPVVSSLGKTACGQATNVNADTAAVHIAVALGAEKLTLLTNVDGVTIDGALVSHLTLDAAQEAIGNGAITGGMIPKIRACMHAVAHGVGKAHLINGTLEHALLLELYTQKGIGTEVVQNGHE